MGAGQVPLGPSSDPLQRSGAWGRLLQLLVLGLGGHTHSPVSPLETRCARSPPGAQRACPSPPLGPQRALGARRHAARWPRLPASEAEAPAPPGLRGPPLPVPCQGCPRGPRLRGADVQGRCRTDVCAEPVGGTAASLRARPNVFRPGASAAVVATGLEPVGRVGSLEQMHRVFPSDLVLGHSLALARPPPPPVCVCSHTAGQCWAVATAPRGLEPDTLSLRPLSRSSLSPAQALGLVPGGLTGVPEHGPWVAGDASRGSQCTVPSQGGREGSADTPAAAAWCWAPGWQELGGPFAAPQGRCCRSQRPRGWLVGTLQAL